MMNHQKGAVNTWMLVSLFLIVAVLATSVATTWAYMRYFDEKKTVETQVDAAVATATKKQADTDAAQYESQAKLPTRTFAGPSDYGSLSFNYPKTWSVYVDKNEKTGSSASYSAYLNPVAVPPVSVTTQQFALRITIEQKDYNTVISSYSQQVKQGDLKSSPVKINGEDATRLDGNFTKDIRGSAVIFKIRDKTVTIRTDADTFGADYNALIATIKFNS